MSSVQNKETQDVVKREIKEIKARCKQESNNIDNSPLIVRNLNLEEIHEKTLCYVEGLGTEIRNSNTLITADENLLTSQFLVELKEKSNQVEEYTAFMRGSIHDIDTETNRLKSLITITQEAKSRPKIRKREVKPEHIYNAKEKFQVMKTELHELVHSLFPNSESVIEIMGELMREHLNQTSNGYIPITTESFQIIELLKDMKIVSVNPYNNMEVKLSY